MLLSVPSPTETVISGCPPVPDTVAYSLVAIRDDVLARFI